MNIVAIIQARMGSTRLPGKVLKQVKGRPLLDYQLERLSQSKLIDQVVIATTELSADTQIVEYCAQKNIKYFQGSEEDVLKRYYDCAVEYRADAIVRITSDCPLIDPMEVDKVIQYYLENQGTFDLVSNTVKRTYPRGMDTAIFSFHALKEAHDRAVLESDREHVTKFIYDHQEQFTIGSVEYETNLSHIRLTVDTPEDFQVIKLIIENPSYHKHFYLAEISRFLKNNADILKINSHIEQKKV